MCVIKFSNNPQAGFFAFSPDLFYAENFPTELLFWHENLQYNDQVFQSVCNYIT